VLVATLDTECPATDSDLAQNLLGGDYANRWSDKSIGLVFFKNGTLGGISEVGIFLVVHIFHREEKFDAITFHSTRRSTASSV